MGKEGEALENDREELEFYLSGINYGMEDLKADFCEAGKFIARNDAGLATATILDIYHSIKYFASLSLQESENSTLPKIVLEDKAQDGSSSWKNLRTPAELIKLLKDQNNEVIFRDKVVTPSNCDLWARQRIVDFLRGNDQSLPNAVKKSK